MGVVLALIYTLGKPLLRAIDVVRSYARRMDSCALDLSDTNQDYVVCGDDNCDAIYVSGTLHQLWKTLSFLSLVI